GDGAEIAAERRREPRALFRLRFLLARGRLVRRVAPRRLRGLIPCPRLMHLSADPAEAFWRVAAAAARALRIAERQPHLEREIGAQEIRQIGTVWPQHDAHLVFAETQIIEQDIA